MAAATISNIEINDPVNVGFVLISEADYTALTTKDPNIFYFVY